MNFVEAIAFAVEKVKAWVNENKQDKLTGTEGQVVGFNAEGKPVAQEASGGGASHWDQLEGKPFVKQGGDTLTWDGNTEGLVSTDGAPFYHVSDAIPTKADCANGIAVVYGPQTLPIDGETAQACFMDDGAASFDIVFVIPYDNYVADGLVFSEAGVYFLNDGGSHISSLTIPNYTGFAKEQIDPKVLPEALQFGKTTVQGDTLEWDGNTEGLPYYGEEMGYKLYDTPFTAEDIANGCTLVFSAEGQEATVEPNIQDIGGAILLDNAYCMVVSVYDESLGELGIYVIPALDKQLQMSLTIPGYTGFTRTEVKTIEPEYLPGAVVLYADAKNGYLYADSDTADTSKRVTKAELEKIALSGRTVYLGAEQSNGLILVAIKTFALLSDFGCVITSVDENYYTAEYTA